jgi:outer membrane protein OmpA-like peptidoglycan-associated protein
MTSRRLVRRLESSSRLPFAPYGLAPLGALVLLLIFALTGFASGAVEDVAGRTARRALDSIGATWATVHVSGQWVTLEGAPPSREAAARAVAAVRDAKTNVLFGTAIPVTRVDERFLPPASIAAAVPGPVAATSSPAPADEIVPPAAAAACDRSLSDLLDIATIEFASSSAIIGPGSAGLLDSVAIAAAACPGVLRIEGHTDNSGGAALNQDLSRSRAEAVRAALVQRGVPGQRLTVEGFGASQPIASNGTAEGRERNRRIEMRVVSPPT